MHTYEAERARCEHAELIRGMDEIYATLIHMRYLHPDELVYPPYGFSGKPSLASSDLHYVGFTDEVQSLLGLLTYPSTELMNRFDSFIPLAPDSTVVSYLTGQKRPGIRTARHPTSDGEIRIPPWAFKLISSGPDSGNNYIYDTWESNAYPRPKDGLPHVDRMADPVSAEAIVRWDSQSQFGEYSDQPMRPVGEALAIMVEELRSLDWLAWRVECGEVRCMNIHSRPTLKQHMSCLGATNRYSLVEEEDKVPRQSEIGLDLCVKEVDRTDDGLLAVTDPSLAEGRRRSKRMSQRLEIVQAALNRYTYKRNLYEKCGWPADFKGDEFEARRHALEQEHHELMGLLGPQAMHIQDIEGGRELREWYRLKADLYPG